MTDAAPPNTAQLLQQAIAHHQAGRLAEAEHLYRIILQIQPNHPDANHNLGVIALQVKQPAGALPHLRIAFESNPDHTQYRLSYIEALIQTGQVGLARQAFDEGRLRRLKDDAVEALARRLNDTPAAPSQQDIDALAARFNEGRYEEAAVLAQALTLRFPQHGIVWKGLGLAFHRMNRNEDALAPMRKAIALSPMDPEAHNNLGIALKELDRLSEAEASCRKALQIKPDFAEVHCNLGNITKELGRLDEAETSYLQAIKFKPDLVIAHYNLVQSRKSNASDNQLDALIVLENEARNGIALFSHNDLVLMNFTLGKYYDDLGDHYKAFPYFLEGCHLKRATLDYKADQTTHLFDAIIHHFSAGAMARLRGVGDPSSVPIFVLGMPRSGTTLTEQIIASHPMVHGAGELTDLSAIAHRHVAGIPYPNYMRQINPAQLTKMGSEYVACLRPRAPDSSRITDKMPGNFTALGLIHLTLPNAKIIHVRRDPVDTCLSCFTKLFSGGQEYSYDLTELGRYYADYARLMDHWRMVLPEGAFLEVQYEDIVADQETQARRLIEYCGLEWDDACLNFHKNKRAVRTASVTQVRQPIYRTSVQRWKPYEKFLGPLFEALGDLAPGR
ncbi:MAG: sulfotransferase [Nitrosomonadales bacterium]|nr:sulfotransferase [Nitrosomonadales bacterium]